MEGGDIMKDLILLVIGLVALGWSGVKVATTILKMIDQHKDEDKNL